MENAVLRGVYYGQYRKELHSFLYLSHLILYHIFISFNPFKLYRKHYVHNNTYL